MVIVQRAAKIPMIGLDVAAVPTKAAITTEATQNKSQRLRWRNQIMLRPRSPESESLLPPPTICRSSACSSSRTSRASSTVTIPSRRLSSETTGIASRLYFAMLRATSSWSSSGEAVTRFLLAISSRRVSGSETIRRFSVTVPDRRPSSSVR